MLLYSRGVLQYHLWLEVKIPPTAGGLAASLLRGEPIGVDSAISWLSSLSSSAPAAGRTSLPAGPNHHKTISQYRITHVISREPFMDIFFCVCLDFFDERKKQENTSTYFLFIYHIIFKLLRQCRSYFASFSATKEGARVCAGFCLSSSPLLRTPERDDL